jgi:hypothetical protein
MWLVARMVGGAAVDAAVIVVLGTAAAAAGFMAISVLASIAVVLIAMG